MNTEQTPTYLIRTDDNAYAENVIDTYSIPETDWMKLPFTIYDDVSAVYVRSMESGSAESEAELLTYVENLPVRVLLASNLSVATEYADKQQWASEVWTWVQVPLEEVVEYSLLSASSN